MQDSLDLENMYPGPHKSQNKKTSKGVNVKPQASDTTPLHVSLRACGPPGKGG